VKSSKHLDKDETNIFLLFFGLVLMLILFVLINLYFYYLGITNDFFISGYWVFAVIPVFYYYYFLQRKGRIFLSELGLKWKGLVKGIAIGIVGGIISGSFGWLVLNILGSPVSALPTNWVIIFLFVSVLSAPLREEFMFRGIFWAVIERAAALYSKKKNVKLDPRKKDVAIIVLISLAFLSVHVGREPGILFTTVLFDSFVFSLVYYKTRNLSAPIIAHAVSNLFVVARPFVFL
jgi:membrane protease YdiL (CAAX protease family)